MSGQITVGDVMYSTEYGAGGWCRVLKVTGHKVLVELEDYDRAIVTLDDVKLISSPDADFDNWAAGLEEDREMYPDRPIEL